MTFSTWMIIAGLLAVLGLAFVAFAFFTAGSIADEQETFGWRE